jgi:Ca2+-binding EF-hand superfamily protein
MSNTDRRGIPRPLGSDEIADLYAEFEACDTDGDGRVGYAEFERLLQLAGSRLSPGQRRAEFARIDFDSNGLIDLAEFKQWWQGT